MALTLRSAIDASQTTIEVVGADAVTTGSVFSIDSEYIQLRSVSNPRLDYQEAARSIWGVVRGVQGTPRATHAAAATLTGVLPGAGGASAHGDLTGVTANQHHAQLHAAAHATGQPDVLTPAAIGADTAAARDAAIADAMGGAMQSVTVTLSSAQILALFTTPIQLVAAPGAGKVVMPISAIAVLDAGATPYDATGVNGLYIGPDPGNVDWLNISGGPDEALFASAVDAAAWFGKGNSGEGFALSAADNQAVLIAFNSANPTAGDGTLDVTVHYVVVDV